MHISYLTLPFIIEISWLSFCVNAGDSTFINRNLNALLKRHKRLAIFPENSVAVLTVATIMTLLKGSPSGNFISYEIDQLFPLPDSIEAFKLKFKTNEYQVKF